MLAPTKPIPKPAMNLLDILSPSAIIAPLKATTKRAVIDELVDALHAQGKVSDPQVVKDAVWQREQTRTTGIGNGLAIPHGKCAGLSGPAMAIGKPAQPIDFEAIDSRPVRLVVLLASPTDQPSNHIQALANLSRLISMDDFREQVYAATSAQEIYELFRAREQR